MSFFVALMLFVFQTSKAQEDTKDWTEKIQLYGHAFSVPTDFTDAEFQFIADHYPIFTVEKRSAYNDYGGNPSSEAATIGTAAKLKALNPDIKVLLYWNSVMSYEGLYESNAEFAAHPEWVHSVWEMSTGTVYDIYDLDNIYCQDWWVNSVVSIIREGDLDGVFLDAGPKADTRGLEEGLSVATDRVRDSIGDDKIVIYNGYRVANETTMQAGPSFIEHMSGVFIEFFLHAPLDTKEEAAFLFDELTVALEDGKMIVPRGTPTSYLPGTEDPFLFSFASFLLFYGPNSYYVYNEGYNKTEGMLDYYPEYFDIATGQSLGSPQRDGWVYTRTFENVSVKVDLENKTSSIDWIDNPVYEPIENLAVLGTATQSSINNDAPASRAIDGDSNGAFGQGSVTHTQSETNAWWQVDLGTSYGIGEISVFNRTDACCTARLSNFTVSVLDEDSVVAYSKSYTTYPDPSVSMDAAGITGRYVVVQLDGSGALSLAEVQVAESLVSESKHAVTVKVVDDATNDSIPLASLLINGDEYTINYVGEVALDLPSGDYPYTLSRDGYETLNSNLNITQDTALTLRLTEMAKHELSIKVSETGSYAGLSEVSVSINENIHTTNKVGEFDVILIEDLYDVTLSKTGYQTIKSSVNLTKDTLLNLKMDREKYSVSLKVVDAELQVAIPSVSIAINDTVYISDVLGMLLIDLDFEDYDYVVSVSGYDDVSQSIDLVEDTLLVISMEATPSGIDGLYSDKLIVYPNPASHTFSLAEDVKEVTIFDMSGKQVAHFNNTQGQCDISQLAKGIYVLNAIMQNGQVAYVKLIKE